jgi:hypothetical protein
LSLFEASKGDKKPSKHVYMRENVILNYIPHTVKEVISFGCFYEECKVGFFGSGCLHSCHCLDDNRCDQVRGKCQTPGCLAGWTGKACAEGKLYLKG